MSLIPYQWSKSKNGIVYKYPQPFFERTDRYSRVIWNPDTRVGELLFNIRTEAPLNPKAMEKQLGTELKRLFNTQRYICIVDQSNKIRNEDFYKTELQFHFKSEGIPEYPDKVPDLIDNHLAFQAYLGTDTKTGETEFFTFQELPPLYKYSIIQQCIDPKRTSKGQPIVIAGKYWEFAE